MHLSCLELTSRLLHPMSLTVSRPFMSAVGLKVVMRDNCFFMAMGSLTMVSSFGGWANGVYSSCAQGRVGAWAQAHIKALECEMAPEQELVAMR